MPEHRRQENRSVHATDPYDLGEQLPRLKQIVRDLLAEARRRGASDAEAAASLGKGLEVRVRLGEVETIEYTQDHHLGITVYFGHRKGSATTSDLSAPAIQDTVQAACAIAKQTQPDPCAGLAAASLLASEVPDLDLYHPWPLPVEAAIDRALACEEAARAFDRRIVNSEGADLSRQEGLHVYGNTRGFLEGYPRSRQSLSCAVVAQEGDSMQRDYWWTSARAPEDLLSAQEVGQRAAQRTVARLGGRQVPTCQVPILFSPTVAANLLRSLVGALSGAALYRRASFLLDHLGARIFPEFVRIHEVPHLPRGLGSAPFDGDGVATRPKDLVRDGILQTYLLGTYSACRLGMTTTGNAGGVHNLWIDMGERDRKALLEDMGTGLLVSELMGHGGNLVTGDYSQGAAGFWVERGEIQYPVEEITIAGNLRDMFRGLVAVGNDWDFQGRIRTGSWLIDHMTIAGC